jgi:hypothetical protein
MNLDHIEEADRDSLEIMFAEKYGGHLATGARFEENIAMAGILAATHLGTADAPRPDGEAFNPYKLTDEELEAAKQLLITQKGRWSRATGLRPLQKLMRPAWSGLAGILGDLSSPTRPTGRAIDFGRPHAAQGRRAG